MARLEVERETGSQLKCAYGAGWGTWIRTKTNRVRVCCATVTPFPNRFPNIFNGLERCSEAEREPTRKSAFLAWRSSIRSPRDLARGLGKCGHLRARDRAFGAGRAPSTPAMVLSSIMHVSCEPREQRQLQVAHFRRKARRLLRQIAKPRAAGPSLAGLMSACNASAPQKGAGQRANFRARLSSRLYAKALARRELAQSLHRTTRFLGVFLGVIII
jgi:hypothetical protein